MSVQCERAAVMSANKLAGGKKCRCGVQTAITHIVTRVHVDAGATQVLGYLLGVTCSRRAQEVVALVPLQRRNTPARTCSL